MHQLGWYALLQDLMKTWTRIVAVEMKMSGQDVVMDWMPGVKCRVKMSPEFLLLGLDEQSTGEISSFSGKSQFCS